MKIAFTSCIQYENFNRQPEWKDIEAQSPDYLFLLGDQIYIDLNDKKANIKNLSLEEFKSIVFKKYEQQWKEPNFQSLIQVMKKKKGLFGIWDDHDFLWNNARGGEQNSVEDKKKIEFSRKIFHQYFENCSANLPELFYHIDTEYARVIFLDNRSYAFKNHQGKSLLGEKQFQFLEEKLIHNKAFTLICGGITLSAGLRVGIADENWKDYPADLERLCHLTSKAKNVLFLAGDVHSNQFISPISLDKGKVTPPQIISSGMQVKMFYNRHNWAMLEFSKQGVQVQFHRRKLFGRKTTPEILLNARCNGWLSQNGYYQS